MRKKLYNRRFKRRPKKGKKRAVSRPRRRANRRNVVLRNAVVEKKRITTFSQVYSVGQVYANSASTYTSGYYVADITPSPAQGTGYTERIGSKICLSGVYFQMQFWQQLRTSQARRIRIRIFNPKIWQASPSAFIEDIIKKNTFINQIDSQDVWDINGPYQTDYSNLYRVVYDRTVRLGGDSFYNTTNELAVRQKFYKFGLKFKDGYVMRYDENTGQNVQGQMIMLVMCDTGNSSTTTITSNNTTIANSNQQTGINTVHSSIWYFVDT